MFAEPGTEFRTLDEEVTRPWRLQFGAEYAEGDYGPREKTETWTLFVAPGFVGEIGEISLTVPALVNDGPTTAGEDARASRFTGDREAGVGDLTLKGRYYLVDEDEIGGMPGVDVLGRLKLPTADEDKNLGTGEFDYGPGLGIYKHVGKAILLADAEYILREEPRGINLDNQFRYSIGAGHPVVKSLNGYVFLDGATGSAPGADSPAEVSVLADWKFSSDTSLQPYAGLGLTDGSPDEFVGLGLTRRF